MTNRVVAHELEILLPVHNEAGSIEKTIREFYSQLPSNINAPLALGLQFFVEFWEGTKWP